MGNNVTSSNRTGQKWLLALDPFSDLDMSRVLTFAKAAAAQIHAGLRSAYVLAPESLNWTGEFSGPWMERYLPFARQKAEEMGKKFGVEVEVVPCSESGLRPSVRALITHAQKTGADLILLSTHGRSGLERWALGSYAETLILSSPIPVLVLNPQHELPPKVANILVPTDLSDASERFIIGVGEMAKDAGAGVTLFYKRPDPLDPMIQQGVYAVGGGWVSVQSYLDTEVSERKKQLARVESSLGAMGVKAETCFDSSSNSLVDGINRCAKEKKADVVALLTQAGPFEAAVLGSVARGLVRASSIPVYIRR